MDTSASRALGMVDEAKKILTQLCASMARAQGKSARVVVGAYDQVVVPVYDGPAAGFGAAEIGRSGSGWRSAPPTSAARSTWSAVLR